MEKKEKEIFVDTIKAGEILGIKSGTLRTWRSQGKGPRFCKAEGEKGMVRYRVSDLNEWAMSLETHK